MHEEIESFPVWFSYANAQSELVHRMYAQMDDGKVEPLASKARELMTNDDPSRYASLRFVPFGYQLENADQTANEYQPLEDSDSRINRLTGADNIQLLMRDISTSLFKVIVLSPAFFQSEACMKELCLSLTSLTSKSENKPFMLFYGFDAPKEVLTVGKYPFYCSDKPMKLSQALMITRAKLLAENAKLRRYYTLEHEDQVFFQELLHAQSNNVYFDVDQLTYTDPKQTTNVSYYLSKSGASTAKFLVTELYRYCYQIFKKTALVSDKTYLDKMYKQWSRRYQVRDLVSFIEDEKQLRFENIRKLEEVENFTLELKDYLESIHPDELLKMDALIYQLCQILLLKGLTCTGADLRRFFAHDSLPLQIFVDDDTQINFKNSHQAELVFCATYGFTPKEKAFLNGKPVGQTLAAGTVAPARFAPDASDNQAVLHKAFEELWERLFPTEGGLDANSLEALRQNKSLRGNIREQIRAKKYNSFGYLLLRMDADGDGTGSFPILDRMTDILNEGYPPEDEVPIPAVILRRHVANQARHLSNTGIAKMDVMFNLKGHSQLHNDLADIRAIYQRGKPQ